MRKIIKKALGPLAIFAMALGVGLSVAKEKTPVGVKAATYTQITNVNQIISGEKYLITSIKKDKTAKIYLPAGAFNFTPAGVEFTDVNLVDSVNAWTINLVDGGYEITDGTNYMYTTGSNTGLRSGTTTNKVWSIFNSTSYPGRLAFKYTGTDRYLTLYLSQDWRSYEVFHDGSQQMSHLIIYQVDSLATPNVMTAIDVTPTTKSYFTTDILTATTFTVNYTKNGVGGSGNGSDFHYTAQIGTGSGATFTGTDIVWGTTTPATTDTTIQFKAFYPTAAYGETYVTAEVTLTVSQPVLQNIVVSGPMTKTSYLTTGVWSEAGLKVTANYDNGAAVDVTSEAVLTFNPVAPNSTTITSVTVSATWSGKTNTYTQNDIVVTQKVDTIMISEVYGGGGNSGSYYKQDFIELYNTTNTDIDLSAGSYYLYYTGAAMGFEGYQQLTGKILAKSYYLVQQAAGTGTTQENLPTPNQSGPWTMNSSTFKVALTNSATAPTGSDDASVIDFVGVGGSANDYEVAAAPDASNINSVARILDVNGEPQDTDNNSVDFVADTPTPMNSAMSVAQKILVGDTEGQCVTRFAGAKELVLKLEGDQLTYFQTGTEDLMVAGRARYVAWAAALGETNIYGTGGGAANDYYNEKRNPLGVAAIIGALGLSAMAGYYFLTRKRN